MFSGKHILLGVTGSIAAYKAAVLTRSLVKEGAEVKVVMTPLAKQFITPLTMATLSRHPILVDFFNPENGEWNSHVSLGTWADLYLIAPATANTIGKMAHGIADNLLLTCYLSARCPVALAPAIYRKVAVNSRKHINCKYDPEHPCQPQRTRRRERAVAGIQRTDCFAGRDNSCQTDADILRRQCGDPGRQAIGKR